MTRQAQTWENIYKRYVSLLCTVYSEFLKPNDKSINNPIKYGPNTLADTSPKRWTNEKHMKGDSTAYVIREI
jgi:hypothetical protein